MATRKTCSNDEMEVVSISPSPTSSPQHSQAFETPSHSSISFNSMSYNELFPETSSQIPQKQNRKNDEIYSEVISSETPKYKQNHKRHATSLNSSQISHTKNMKKDDKRNKAFEAATTSFERMAQVTEAILKEPDEEQPKVHNNFVAFGNFIAAELATREHAKDLMSKIMQIFIDDNY